jgi:glycosyltransferase involved in cell wall biosynthesis
MTNRPEKGKSRHIAITIDSLKAGGAERVASVMANYWAKNGYRVTVITFKREPSFYHLDDKIGFIQLGIAEKSGNLVSGIFNTRRRVKILTDTLKEAGPDVIISFFDDINVLSINAGRINGIPVIITERSNPFKKSVSFRWRVAARLFYKYAVRLVVQTESAQRYYRNYGVVTAVIPNPVGGKAISDHLTRKKIVLGVGRLTAQKGFDRLIRAFAKSGLDKEWQLVILGEGELREALESLVSELGLSDRVFLPGLVKEVEDYYHRASIFVLSSHFEGFPNALAEAMSAGIACISFECPFGPKEIIRHQNNGLLVSNGDVAELGMTIQILAEDPEKRKRLGEQANEDIQARFMVKNVMEKWNVLIDEVVK